MKKILFQTTAILIFAFIAQIKAQDQSEVASKLISKKEYEQALQIAKKFLKNDTSNEALKILIQLRTAGVNTKEVYECIGDAYTNLNVPELALTNYTEAESIDSLDTNIKFKSAELLYKSKRYTEAVNKYLKITSLDPKDSRAYLEAANILFQAKLYADASVMYEKYLTIDQSREAYERITKALLEARNFEKAVQYAEQGLTKYPGDNSILKHSALSNYYLKNFSDASKYYSQIPDSLLSTADLLNAARAYQQIKADSSAIKYFEKAIKQDSTLSSIYMDLANYNYLNKNYDTAIKYYKAKLQTDSTYEPAYRFMAFAFMQQQNYPETREALLHATALNDTTVSTRFWLAQTYRQMDSLSQAGEQFSKLLQMIGSREAQFKNEIAEANGFLGQRSFEHKNYTGAVGYLRKAVSLKPEILAYKVMLASALHQSGNTEEAIVWYKKIIAIDPKNEIARKGLRMLSAD